WRRIEHSPKAKERPVRGSWPAWGRERSNSSVEVAQCGVLAYSGEDRFRDRFGGGQAQAFADRALLAGKIGDGVALEHLEKGPQRFTQGPVEVTLPDQRAIGTILEALGEGKVLLGKANGVEQGDFVGGLAEADATMTASDCLQQTIFHQRLDQLEQEQLGDPIRLGDLGHAAQPRLVYGAIDQGANGVVGLSGESHVRPLRYNSHLIPILKSVNS